MATIGHNGPPADQAGGGVAADRLKSFIYQLERLDGDKQDVQETIKDKFAELKGEGFDVKTVRRVLRLRKMKPHDRTEAAELLETYCDALGMEALLA